MNSFEIRSRLADNVAAVEARIAAACARAGRKREEVSLIAVTKYVDIDVAALLPELGVRDLGESRPQELWRKAAALPDLRWHMIGHLQRNKVERTLPLVHLIHSVDSDRLLEALDAEAAKLGRQANILLEVNLSGERNKHGYAAAQVSLIEVDFVWIHSRVVPHGLMTMAAHAEDPEQARPVFRELRELRETIRSLWLDFGRGVNHLSMGMTNDFEVAIEEGATMVRIGSALFEGIVE
jgi:pyridoxal phosphate enzyme (YggS family)